MNRPTPQRVIKKYSNRRLYDTAESRYITLDELAESIRRGAEARVLDAQSGEDLTQATLAQIIIEGRGAAQFLSVPILTQLIRMNDDALSEFFGRWLSAALELYQQARQGVQAIAPYNPLAAMPFAAGNVISRMLSVMPGPWMPSQPYSPPAFSQPQHQPPPPEAPMPDVVATATAEAHPSPAQSDASSIESIRRELDELKRSLRGAASQVVERPAKKRETASSKTSARKKS